MPGWRSSDFLCFVHLLVALSMTSIMSLATLRGRLVIWLLPVVGEDDRGFAAVGELDAGVRQVQGADDRLAGVGAHLRQGTFEPLAGGAARAEWVADRGAPAGARHDLSGDRAACVQSGLVQAERKLNHVREIIFVDSHALFVFERVRIAARTQEQSSEMVFADDAEVFWRDRPSVFAHRRQQFADAGAVDLLHSKERSQRDMRATDFLQHLALHGAPGETAELGDELPHGALPLLIAITCHLSGQRALPP